MHSKWIKCYSTILSSSLSWTSSKSPHRGLPSQHDEMAAEKEKSSSKMMYKGPQMDLITISEDKHLQAEKMNFQRGKVIKIPVEDCTPRRLEFKQRVPIDNRNDDNRKHKVEDCTPKRLKFRQGVHLDNKNGDKQNARSEESTTRLKFRRRVLVGNRNADDNQNDRGEDSILMKLKFRQRVVDNNKSGYIQNNEGDTSKNNYEGKEADVGQANAIDFQSDKISLRHNGVEKKKDSGTLCKDVIEETASRLVRTKTSKVKALVSAFESVTSHLDTRI